MVDEKGSRASCRFWSKAVGKGREREEREERERERERERGILLSVCVL